ncbi:IucA/IucC family protein [Streptomyces sp. NEAU-YJ-81]|uniref:IucA/IucC family protein n=1 Tax=Streptomyces sp. NEAU-YJ-81 TaxID=2820288 RepID=UPI001ABD2A03|nr:IucA/IucC family protein [Streptomyces sp. NEAU-YJ-81]MBO3677108.1 IucA/IucC family protein [Streptomyces sp. NEAU-YJ-81]
MTEEEELLGRVLDTLLREDAYKLRSRATLERRADGDWLRIALEGGESVLLPVEPEGFQCDIRARRRPLRLSAPATAEWTLAERADAEPGDAERTSAEPGGAERADAEPGDADRAPAGRADAESAPAEPGDAERTSAEPADADRADAEPGGADRVDAEPGGAERSPAEPAPAEPACAEPADAEPPSASGPASESRDCAPAERPLTGLAPVLGRLRAAVPEEDRPLYDVFVTECRQALDAMRLHTRIRPAVVAELAARHGEGQWTGMPGAVAYDTLAAFRDHPVYPTSRGRAVFTEGQLRAHAPEFHPTFLLRWLVLPREAVGGDPARLPDWWPTPAQLGLGSGRPSDERRLAFPVHPLTVGRPLEAALRAAGLDGEARLADRPLLDVRPTLSMRTVAVADDPLVHLKLPLTTATLGMRNRRSVKPGTLIDGEVAQRLVEAVIAREPRFGATVLLADETTHLHAGHELLATLVRRYPPGLENATIVPLAGLLAPAPDGTLVIDGLAERHYGGDVLALLDDYLTLLFDFHTTLFAYGIALESHQQNISLVFEGGGGGGGDNAGAVPRLRLLIKDHDGPRVHAIRLAAMVGGGPAADLCGFDDRRILTSGDGPVADVFTTITVHLCAAAPVFELARLGRAPLDTLLRRLRDRLTDAVDRLAVTRPGAAAALLRRRVLDADRLPVKAMVTAGTLFTKERSGAADINKHYVTGPNYLLRGSGR